MEGQFIRSTVISQLDEQVWERFFPVPADDNAQDTDDDDIETMIERGED